GGDGGGADRRAGGDGRAEGLVAAGAGGDRGGDLAATRAGERDGAGGVAEAEALDDDGLAGVQDRLDGAVDEVDAGDGGRGLGGAAAGPSRGGGEGDANGGRSRHARSGRLGRAGRPTRRARWHLARGPQWLGVVRQRRRRRLRLPGSRWTPRRAPARASAASGPTGPRWRAPPRPRAGRRGWWATAPPR